MPLGTCARCERAFIFGRRADGRTPACPRCGRALEAATGRAVAGELRMPPAAERSGRTDPRVPALAR